MRINGHVRAGAVVASVLAIAMWSCAGSDGKDGAQGAAGQAGAPGEDGAQGPAGPAGPAGQGGAPGAPGGNGQDGQNGWGLSTGVKLTVNGVAVAADGSVSVDFTMLDDQGMPVDNQGVYTKGVAKPRFGLAKLDTAGGVIGQYTSISRSSSGSPTMFNTANAGTGTVAEVTPRSGHYTYQFPASMKIAAADSSKTHTVFVQLSRQLDVLDPATRYVTNVTYDFVPAGGTPVEREIVTTAACNQCHNPLAIHGGGRRDVKLCTLCHQKELENVNDWGAFDLPFFAHAIHSRQNLGADGDFSEVTYPQELRDCNVCHAGAKQAAQINTNAGVKACTGCHSYLVFDHSAAVTCNIDGAWGSTEKCNHVGAVINASSNCTQCHVAEVDHKFADAYWNLANNPPNLVTPSGKNPVVKTRIDAVSFNADRIPTFTFTITTSYDGGPDEPRDLLAKPMQTIRFAWATSLAGAKAMEYVTVALNATAPYAPVSQRWNIPGWPPVAGGAVLPVETVPGTPGRYTWTAPSAVPEKDANGTAFPPSQTFAFAIETAEGDEYYDPDGAGPLPEAPVELRGVTSNVFFWRLDNQNTGNNKPLQRRKIVDDQKCFVCHGAPYQDRGFGFHHAGSRNNVQECSFCHDAVQTDTRITRILPTEGTQTRMDQSIQLSVMIHKMHLGAESADKWPYYNNSGRPLEFATYPGNLLDCGQCHVDTDSSGNPVAANSRNWGLPLNAAVHPTSLSREYSCTPAGCTQVGDTILTPRATAVCGACHDTALAKAHMNQNVIGADKVETCDLCHGLYKEADVRKLHVPAP